MANTSVKKYRQFVGLSQEQMAQKSGITLGSYRAKEQGKVHFNDVEKIIIRNILETYLPGISIEALFFNAKSTEKVLYRKEG